MTEGQPLIHTACASAHAHQIVLLTPTYFLVHGVLPQSQMGPTPNVRCCTVWNVVKPTGTRDALAHSH